MLQHVSLFLLGLIILVGGAEALIRGAVRIATALGVSPFMIGFTLIGFGTSAPELVVSLSAAMQGSSDIALGNVVGSNIANIGLVLALAALIRPLVANMRLLKIETPVIVLVSVLLWFICRDGELRREDGIVLLVGFVGLCLYMYRNARAEPPKVQAEVKEFEETFDNKMPVWLASVLVIVGLIGLVGGAHLMVEAAVEIARSLGVSELLIGLTIVAVGTSLPEVAAALAAAYRGESDIVLGNIAGSNLFNILLILGITVVVQPMNVPENLIAKEIPIMIGFAVLFMVTVATGLRVSRLEAFGLLLAYCAFIMWQVGLVS